MSYRSILPLHLHNCRIYHGNRILTLFPLATNLQQKTEHILSKNRNLHNWNDNLWLKVENIVAKGEIACFEQFLLLSLCFQKAVCCRGVRKRLYESRVNPFPFATNLQQTTENIFTKIWKIHVSLNKIIIE